MSPPNVSKADYDKARAFADEVSGGLLSFEVDALADRFAEVRAEGIMEDQSTSRVGSMDAEQEAADRRAAELGMPVGGHRLARWIAKFDKACRREREALAGVTAAFKRESALSAALALAESRVEALELAAIGARPALETAWLRGRQPSDKRALDALDALMNSVATVLDAQCVNNNGGAVLDSALATARAALSPSQDAKDGGA